MGFHVTTRITSKRSSATSHSVTFSSHHNLHVIIGQPAFESDMEEEAVADPGGPEGAMDPPVGGGSAQHPEVQDTI